MIEGIIIFIIVQALFIYLTYNSLRNKYLKYEMQFNKTLTGKITRIKEGNY